MKKKKRKYGKAVNPIHCYVCEGKPPYGKCLICGFSVPAKDIDPHWKLRYEYLRDLWKSLRRNVATSTGIYSLDLELVQKFGPWRRDIEIERSPTTLKILRIKVPIAAGERHVMQEKSVTDEDIARLLNHYDGNPL